MAGQEAELKELDAWYNQLLDAFEDRCKVSWSVGRFVGQGWWWWWWGTDGCGCDWVVDWFFEKQNCVFVRPLRRSYVGMDPPATN